MFVDPQLWTGCRVWYQWYRDEDRASFAFECAVCLGRQVITGVGAKFNRWKVQKEFGKLGELSRGSNI
jgi:hypothetical protein